jgi:predicted ATPase
MGGQPFTASALSDGTLRFLALAIMASDPGAQGVTCMEEPENGIHPLRIPQIVELVRQLSDAPDLEGDTWSNVTKLRQVIINTHSPLVVAELNIDELLMADKFHFQQAQWVQFKAIKDSWRGKYASSASACVSKGQVIAYLSGQPLPAKPGSTGAWANDKTTNQTGQLF